MIRLAKQQAKESRPSRAKRAARPRPNNTPAHAHASDAPEIDLENCPF